MGDAVGPRVSHLKKTRAKTRRAGARHQTGPFRVGRSRTGLGLFATEPIRRGKFIIEYWGKLLRWADVDDINNKYLFDLNTRWAIDGSPRRNTARYINHSCRPNAVPYGVGRKIKIYAKRTIQPDEEITYDYGKEYFDQILAPIGCRCAACIDTAKGRKKSGKAGAKRRRRGARA